jgi:3-hydroxyisobutyrate dehydrogenase-like beta-hydroxyacid dehydrogenase
MAATTASTIGFVGLGHMGGNMAVRLLNAGHAVHGEDRNRGHLQASELDRLQWHKTAKDVAEAVDIVVTSLPDDDALEAVASGHDGLLAGLRPGQVWIEMSTVSPRASRGLAERVRTTGAALLDAPVSGSVPQAQAGTLTIMVGGDEKAYARVEGLLRELGTPTYIGDHGQGLALKLAINISLAVQMLAFAEGLDLAVRAGVDRKLAVDVMTRSAIGSPMLKARAPLVLDLPEDAWFDVGLMRKDLQLALDLGNDLRAPLPATLATDQVLEAARAAGYGHRDIAVLYRVLAETPPGVVADPGRS